MTVIIRIHESCIYEFDRAKRRARFGHLRGLAKSVARDLEGGSHLKGRIAILGRVRPSVIGPTMKGRAQDDGTTKLSGTC